MLSTLPINSEVIWGDQGLHGIERNEDVKIFHTRLSASIQDRGISTKNNIAAKLQMYSPAKLKCLCCIQTNCYKLLAEIYHFYMFLNLQRAIPV